MANFADFQDDLSQELIPSAAVTPADSINLNFHESLLKTMENREIVAIDIMFGTYARTNAGSAILELEKVNNERIALEIQLSSLLDNRYSRFNVPGSSYVAGNIQWSTGGGVSVWETNNETETRDSCIKLLFSDGSWGVTPGCPLY